MVVPFQQEQPFFRYGCTAVELWRKGHLKRVSYTIFLKNKKTWRLEFNWLSEYHTTYWVKTRHFLLQTPKFWDGKMRPHPRRFLVCFTCISILIDRLLIQSKLNRTQEPSFHIFCNQKFKQIREIANLGLLEKHARTCSNLTHYTLTRFVVSYHRLLQLILSLFPKNLANKKSKFKT